MIARADTCLSSVQPRHSTTINHVEPGFAIRYVTPGSAVQGSYFNDDFGIVGLEPLKLHNITMAIAEQAAGVQIGIMGIGLDTNEARSNNGTTYLNFIDQMVKQDKINSRSYSLWLDGLREWHPTSPSHDTKLLSTDASTGTILFGGYDRAKYHGNLTHLKIQADIESGTFNTMTVAWTSLSVTNPNGINYLTPLNFSSLAILDAGTTFTGVPTALFAQLAAYFDVVQNETYGYLVRCNVSDYLGSIDFGFGGSAEPTISINYSEFVIPPYNSTNNPVMFPDGSEACLFGMFPIADGEQILFGDTFLRSAYVVYNLDELEISIAPTNFGSTSSDIIEISKMT